ncbi:AAEL012504-PB [Aedes aegypti]|uniref:AAEL012504-PA n=1 Tax=Aedes aegypti TaxID=7159 RepID=Q16LW4_AEDAE|nr:AAEL012504-PA [Aedes aegypti]EAT35310.1 AAEL012504-PB [Aedes aegypti]
MHHPEQKQNNDEVLVVKHVPGTAELDTRYDVLLLCGFILTVIVVGMILRLALQVTRARLITTTRSNQDETASSDGSVLSLVLRR